MDRIAIDSGCFTTAGVHLTGRDCGSCGEHMGRFIPNREVLDRDQCPYTPEELEEMLSETGGCTLEELWKSLGVK